MKDASEDEQLEDFVVQSKPAVPNIQRKNEREETLRKMMEDGVFSFSSEREDLLMTFRLRRGHGTKNRD